MNDDERPATIRIRASRALCQGWANCQRWAPEVYFLDDEGDEIGFQHLEVPAELLEAAWLGADACPQGAIQVLAPRPPRRMERRPSTTTSAAPIVSTPD